MASCSAFDGQRQRRRRRGGEVHRLDEVRRSGFVTFARTAFVFRHGIDTVSVALRSGEGLRVSR